MTKETKFAVCQKCNSQNLTATANVHWDRTIAEWVLYGGQSHDVHDAVFCEDCDDECVEGYITEQELKVRQVTKRLKGESV